MSSTQRRPSAIPADGRRRRTDALRESPSPAVRSAAGRCLRGGVAGLVQPPLRRSHGAPRCRLHRSQRHRQFPPQHLPPAAPAQPPPSHQSLATRRAAVISPPVPCRGLPRARALPALSAAPPLAVSPLVARSVRPRPFTAAPDGPRPLRTRGAVTLSTSDALRPKTAPPHSSACKHPAPGKARVPSPSRRHLVEAVRVAAGAIAPQRGPLPPCRPPVVGAARVQRRGSLCAQLVQHSAGPQVRIGEAGPEPMQTGLGCHQAVGKEARRGQR